MQEKLENVFSLPSFCWFFNSMSISGDSSKIRTNFRRPIAAAMCNGLSPFWKKIMKKIQIKTYFGRFRVHTLKPLFKIFYETNKNYFWSRGMIRGPQCWIICGFWWYSILEKVSNILASFHQATFIKIITTCKNISVFKSDQELNT